MACTAPVLPCCECTACSRIDFRIHPHTHSQCTLHTHTHAHARAHAYVVNVSAASSFLLMSCIDLFMLESIVVYVCCVCVRCVSVCDLSLQVSVTLFLSRLHSCVHTCMSMHPCLRIFAVYIVCMCVHL